MSAFPGIYNGWYYGGALYSQPVEPAKLADPDAKAKPGEPLKRDSYTWGSAGDARYAGWAGKEPPWDLSVAAAMWRYSAVQLVLGDIACPILAAPRSFEVRNEDGTEASKSKQQGPRTGDGVTSAPEDKLKDALEAYFEPRWLDILSSLKQCIHYGWALSEVVYGRQETPAGTLTLPERFPDFQPWDATLLRDEFGRFAGFRPRWGKGDGTDDRDARYALHFTEGGEQNPLFGFGRSVNAVADWWDAINSRDNRGRAENKASGINMLIAIASGQSFRDDSGNAVVPADAAQSVFNALSSGGAAVVPLTFWKREDIRANPALAEMRPVHVDQFDWGNTAPAIESALKARDASDVRIVRAYGRKERGLMEAGKGGIGQSDAQVHRDSDELDGEQIHARLMRQFSQQTLNTVLVTNKGAAFRDRIYVKAGPMSDDAKAWRRELVATLAAQPGHEVGMSMDAEELMRDAGAPRKPGFVMPAPLSPDEAMGGGEVDDEAVEPGMNGQNGTGNGRLANVG